MNSTLVAKLEKGVVEQTEEVAELRCRLEQAQIALEEKGAAQRQEVASLQVEQTEEIAQLRCRLEQAQSEMEKKGAAQRQEVASLQAKLAKSLQRAAR